MRTSSSTAPSSPGSLTTLKSRVRDTAIALQSEQQQRITDVEQELRRLPEWAGADSAGTQQPAADLEMLAVTASEDLTGLRLLVYQEFNIQSQVQDIKTRIQETGQQRLQDKGARSKNRLKRRGRRKSLASSSPKIRLPPLQSSMR